MTAYDYVTEWRFDAWGLWLTLLMIFIAGNAFARNDWLHTAGGVTACILLVFGHKRTLRIARRPSKTAERFTPTTTANARTKGATAHP